MKKATPSKGRAPQGVGWGGALLRMHGWVYVNLHGSVNVNVNVNVNLNVNVNVNVKVNANVNVNDNSLLGCDLSVVPVDRLLG